MVVDAYRLNGQGNLRAGIDQDDRLLAGDSHVDFMQSALFVQYLLLGGRLPKPSYAAVASERWHR
jgi:hypothetical protein